MKKKLSVLMLLICCLLVLSGCGFHKEWYAATCETPKTCVECGETEGEALGHSWVDATCEAPKTCTACAATEGEALGHSWVDATTEAPKTCTTCAATEGERIVTDPRFTTAATKDLHGTWVGTVTLPSEMMGVAGLNVALKMEVTMVLGNEGSMKMNWAIVNLDEFAEALKTFMVDTAYAQYAAAGVSAEQAEELFKDQNGMTIAEYASTTVDAMNVSSIFDATMGAMEFSGVYYVEGDQLYSGLSWDTEIGGLNFTLNGDVFTLDAKLPEFGIDAIVFNRVTA